MNYPRARSMAFADSLPPRRGGATAFALSLLLLTTLVGTPPLFSAEPQTPESAQVASSAGELAPTGSDADLRTPISRSARGTRRMGGFLGSEGSGSSGWWFGMAGVALVLAACGGLSLAARKYIPQRSSTLLQVVGRVPLSPKQSIVLVKAGGRVLLVGTGPQGAPSYLGELVETDDRAEFFGPEESLTPAPLRIPVHASGSRLDVRLGDKA